MKVHLGNILDLKNNKVTSVKSLVSLLKELKGEVTVEIEGRIIDETPLIIDGELTARLKSLRVISQCGSFFCAKKLNSHIESGYTVVTVEDGCRTFFADGKRLNISRLPKEGYFGVKKPYGDKFGGFYGEEGREIDLNTFVTVWPGGNGGTENWHTVTCPISEYDEKSGLIKMEIPSPLLEIGRGSRYKLLNVSILEDGEFFIDKRKNRAVIKGEYKEIYGVSQSSSIVIKDNACPVEIDGLEIFGGNADEIIHGEFGQRNGLIYIENAKDVTVKNCHMHDVGSHAVSIYGNNENIEVKSNFIKDVFHSGVAIVGYDGKKYKSVRHKIEDNRIENVGLTVGHASGISVIKASEISIENNTVLKSPRYAISIKGRASAYLSDGKLVDSNDWEQYENKVKIIANDLSQCNLDSQDTGVIEGYFAKNLQIKDNYVHDSNIPFSFGTGIYLDDECADVEVSGNLIERLGSLGNGRLSNAITVKGERNKVVNNKICDCNIESGGGYFNVLHLGSGTTSNTQIYSNYFKRSGDCFLACSNWSDDRIDGSNFNLFTDKPNLKGVFHSLSKTDFDSWKKQSGFDGLSVFSDNEIENFPLLGISQFDALRIGSSVGTFDKTKKLIVTANGKGESTVYAKVGEQISLGLVAIDEKGVKKRVGDCSFDVDVNAKIQGGNLVCLNCGIATVTAEYEGVVGRLYVAVGSENAKFGAIVSKSEEVCGRTVEILPFMDYGPYKKKELDVDIVTENCYAEKLHNCIKVRLEVGYCHVLLKKDGRETLVKLNGLKNVLDRLTVKDVFGFVGERKEISNQTLDENGLEKEVLKTVDGVRYNGEILLDSEGVKERKFKATDGKVSLEKEFKTISCQPYLGELSFTNVGGCDGIVGKMNGKTLIASNGSNIWFESDDASFLYGEQVGDFEAILRIGKFYCPNRNTQCGLLIRKSQDPSSEAFNLRITGNGDYMVAIREKFKAGVIGAYSSLPILFPELKIVRKGQVVTAYVNGDEFYSIENIFSGKLLVGVCLFSGDSSQSACAEIEKYKVEKIDGIL